MKKIIFGMISLLLIMPNIVLGANFQVHEQRAFVSVPIDDDLYIAGEQLRIDSDISGDLVAAGGKIEINSTVKEDLIVAGGKIIIDGNIGDDVRVAGGDIEVRGKITDDIIVIGAGTIYIHKDAEIGGDLIANGGEIRIDGTINGKLIVNGGKVIFNGNINETLDINSGSLEINGQVVKTSKIISEEIIVGSNAKLIGNVEYWTKEGKIDFGPAKAKYNEELGKKVNEWKRDLKGLLIGIKLVFFMSGVLTILLLVFFRKLFVKAAENIKTNILINIGVGFIYFIFTPIISILLLVTLIGIPLGIFLIAVYGFSIFFAVPIISLVAALYLENHYNKKWNTLKLFGASIGIYTILGFIIAIPIIGGLIKIFLAISVFGSILTSKKDK